MVTVHIGLYDVRTHRECCWTDFQAHRCLLVERIVWDFCIIANKVTDERMCLSKWMSVKGLSVGQLSNVFQEDSFVFLGEWAEKLRDNTGKKKIFLWT